MSHPHKIEMTDGGKYIIRLMKEKDIEEVLNLHYQLFPVKYSLNVMKTFLYENYLSLLLVYKNSDENEKIIGVSTSRRSWEGFFSTSKIAYLSTFGIESSFRQKHLGSDFIQLTLKILKNYYHCISISLHVQYINKIAFNFYKKNGFEADKIISNHYNFDGDASKAVLMCYNFNKNNKFVLKNDIHLTEEVIQLLENGPYTSWIKSFFVFP